MAAGSNGRIIEIAMRASVAWPVEVPSLLFGRSRHSVLWLPMRAVTVRARHLGRLLRVEVRHEGYKLRLDPS